MSGGPNRIGRGLALAGLAVTMVAFGGAAATAAAEDTCPPDWTCGVVAPPVDEDQAGNPQPVTIGATPIPNVPPAVTYPIPPFFPAPTPPVQAPTKCKAKAKTKAESAGHKKCRKKK